MKDNSDQTKLRQQPEWEQRLKAESDALRCSPDPGSWEKLNTLLARPTVSGPRRVRWLARTLVAAAAMLGLVLVARHTLLPADHSVVWSGQEVRETQPGYFDHYLAAAHGLTGYRPVGEGGADAAGTRQPWSDAPGTE
jgi:hypothetical protein